MSGSTDHRSYQPIKPAASRMLAKRWDDKAYSQHKTKLAKAKSTIDTRPPKTYVHLHLKLKKLQLEEERLATIERDNRLLTEKMTHIVHTKGSVDNKNDYQRNKSLRSARQKQELLRITHENKAIYRRISTKQPHYSARQWESDYDRNMQLKSQITSFPEQGKAPARKGSKKGKQQSVAAEAPPAVEPEAEEAAAAPTAPAQAEEAAAAPAQAEEGEEASAAAE